MAIDRLSMTYSQRAELAENAAARKLFHLMEDKQTNLALAADFYDTNQFVSVLDKVGSNIVVVKTHMDLMEYGDHHTSKELETEVYELAEKHNFMIFEDRKFVDIGGVSKRQFQKGYANIVEWSHLTNAFTIMGPGIVQGLEEAMDEYLADNAEEVRGLILLPYVTPEGNLTTRDFAQGTMDIGAQFPASVMGLIGAGKPAGRLEHEVEETHSGTLIFTPGCKLPDKTKAVENERLGQVYTDPKNLISRGSDVIIVGSGIYGANNPVKMAAVYQKAGWNAYLARTSQLGDE